MFLKIQEFNDSWTIFDDIYSISKTGDVLVDDKMRVFCKRDASQVTRDDCSKKISDDFVQKADPEYLFQDQFSNDPNVCHAPSAWYAVDFNNGKCCSMVFNCGYLLNNEGKTIEKLVSRIID